MQTKDAMEVDTKPFATELVQNDWDSEETFKNFPARNSTCDQPPIDERSVPNAIRKCEIRQQSCERLIEIDPIAVDFAINSDEIQGGSSYIAQQSTKAKCVATNQHKQKKAGNGNEDSQSEDKSKRRQPSNQGASKEYTGKLCDKDYDAAACLTHHRHQKHAGERIFKCQLCGNS